jgi:hypothetical protein
MQGAGPAKLIVVDPILTYVIFSSPPAVCGDYHNSLLYK